MIFNLDAYIYVDIHIYTKYAHIQAHVFIVGFY